jgi:hypothetical protein
MHQPTPSPLWAPQVPLLYLGFWVCQCRDRLLRRSEFQLRHSTFTSAPVAHPFRDEAFPRRNHEPQIYLPNQQMLGCHLERSEGPAFLLRMHPFSPEAS